MKDTNTNTTDIPTYAIIKETGKHGIIYGVMNALHLAISFILIPIYTRYIPPKDYGALALIVMTLSIFSLFFSLGLEAAYFRFFFDSNQKSRQRLIANTTFSIKLLAGLSLICVGISASEYLSTFLFGTTAYTTLLQLMFIQTACLMILNTGLAVLRTERRSKEYFVFSFMHFILQLVLIIILVAVLYWGLTGIILGKLITTAVISIAIVIYLHDYFKLRLSPKIADGLLRFGTPLVFSGLASFLLTWFDRYYLNIFRTLDEVGIYNLGYQLGSIMNVFLLAPFALIWSPMRMEVRNNQHARKYYSKMLSYIVSIGLFLFLLISLMAVDGIKIVAGKNYWSAYTVIPFICLGYVFLGICETLNLGIVFSKKTLYILFFTIFGAGLNIGLNLYFIPVYGMIGAAFTTCIAYFAMVFLYYYVNRSLFPVTYELKKIVLLVGIALTLFCIGWLLPVHMILSMLGISTDSFVGILFGVLARGVIVLCYPLILWYGGIFHKNEKESFKRLISEILHKITLKARKK